MVVIGQTVQHYKSLSIEHLLRFSRVIGLECVELNPQGVSLDNIDSVLSVLGNLKVTFHLPIVGIEGYDFSFPDAKAKIDKVVSLINGYKSDLGILLAVFHPIEGKGNYDTLVENLSRLDVPLVVENIPIYSNEKFLELYTHLKEDLGAQLKGWLFDLAHSYLKNGFNKMFELLDVMPVDELEEVHLSDCTANEDSHYAFGAGILPIDDAIRKLKGLNYDKIIVNEVDAYPGIWSVIDSYLYVAKHFNKRLYYRILARKFFVKPLVQRKLRRYNIR